LDETVFDVPSSVSAEKLDGFQKNTPKCQKNTKKTSFFSKKVLKFSKEHSTINFVDF